MTHSSENWLSKYKYQNTTDLIFLLIHLTLFKFLIKKKSIY
jgi:uncharacterized membrane protein